jgi:hypothetical protein
MYRNISLADAKLCAGVEEKCTECQSFNKNVSCSRILDINNKLYIQVIDIPKKCDLNTSARGIKSAINFSKDASMSLYYITTLEEKAS